MTRFSLAGLTRTLAHGGSRRWAIRRLAAGTLSVGLISSATQATHAQEDEIFQQCLRACLASCTATPHCPTFEDCAASCSQGLL